MYGGGGYGGYGGGMGGRMGAFVHGAPLACAGAQRPCDCRFFETLRTDRKGGFVILGVIRGYGPIWAVCGLPTGPRAEFWPTRGPTTVPGHTHTSLWKRYTYRRGGAAGGGLEFNSRHL